MKTLTPEQYQAVEEFANGLKGCYEASKKENGLVGTTASHFIRVIDIHLDLANLKLQQYDLELRRREIFLW